jgi:hypothetical protein
MIRDRIALAVLPAMMGFLIFGCVGSPIDEGTKGDLKITQREERTDNEQAPDRRGPREWEVPYELEIDDMTMKIEELDECNKRLEELGRIFKVSGSIVGVSNQVNLVVINVGDDDGVLVGMDLVIFRGNSPFGILAVEKIYPKQAAGRVKMITVREEVKKGDGVSTRIE